MKNLLFISFLFLHVSMVKSQCIRIYVSEKIKGIEIPVQRTEFEIFVNDTLKRKLESDNSGFLVRLSLNEGKYNIKILNPGYLESKMDNVLVQGQKSTEITMVVVPIAGINTGGGKNADGK